MCLAIQEGVHAQHGPPNMGLHAQYGPQVYAHSYTFYQYNTYIPNRYILLCALIQVPHRGRDAHKRVNKSQLKGNTVGLHTLLLGQTWPMLSNMLHFFHKTAYWKRKEQIFIRSTEYTQINGKSS